MYSHHFIGFDHETLEHWPHLGVFGGLLDRLAAVGYFWRRKL